MDLLTNYESSDEDEHRESPPPPHQRTTAFIPVRPEEDRDFLSNPLPLPKFKSFPNPEPERESGEATQSDEGAVGSTKSKLASSSSFLSFLPLPKSSAAVSNSKSKSASLFSSLPLPKSSSSSSSSAKRVVQFRPPSIMKSSGTIDEEDEDDDEGEKEIQRKKFKQSVPAISKVSLASIMPPPKNETLGALPSATGSGRRSMLETGISNSCGSRVSTAVSDVVTSSSIGPESSFSDAGASPYAGNFSNQYGEIYGGINPTMGPYDADYYSYENPQAVEYANYEGGYADYGHHYEHDQALAGTGSLPESSGVAENLQQVMGRRGRKDSPAEIIEVKQDELMKNRPRQDQVKLTGIAFGPSYQPTSTKGKPTKLHKRKHQIGSLYFDLKQRETELAERRAKGFLTKAQTQAKYGW